MYCNRCGKEIQDGTKFCPECGANQDGTNNDQLKVVSDINNFFEDLEKKNSDQLIKNETIICKAKWNIIPFIIIWGLFFLYLFIHNQVIYNVYYNNDYYKYNYYEGYYPYRGLFNIVIFLSIVICALSIWLFLKRRELLVTDKKIYGRVGLIGTSQYIIPIKKINYINVKYSIIGRLLKFATLTVIPGTIFGIRFMFISNVKELKNAIETMIYNNK